MLKIFIDDDDDDDEVEGTRTGPSAVRSDLEHQVNHDAKIFHFYHVFSSYEEGGPTGAGKTRCLAVRVVSLYLHQTSFSRWSNSVAVCVSHIPQFLVFREKQESNWRKTTWVDKRQHIRCAVFLACKLILSYPVPEVHLGCCFVPQYRSQFVALFDHVTNFANSNLDEKTTKRV